MAVVAYLRVSTENNFGKPTRGNYAFRREEWNEYRQVVHRDCEWEHQ